jgi:Spy/CpxP family protein refolding chaperone
MKKVQSSKFKVQSSACSLQLVACGLLLAVGIGLGQPLPGYGAGHGGPHHASPVPNRKLEALRIWRLTQELNLSEEQAMQFFPKLKRMRELRQEHRIARQAMLDELEALLAQDPVEPAGLKPVLDSLDTIDENMRESELKLRREIADLLTVEQQARLYVFEATFDRQARRMIEQIRGDKERPKGKR